MTSTFFLGVLILGTVLSLGEGSSYNMVPGLASLGEGFTGNYKRDNMFLIG